MQTALAPRYALVASARSALLGHVAGCYAL